MRMRGRLRLDNSISLVPSGKLSVTEFFSSETGKNIVRLDIAENRLPDDYMMKIVGYLEKWPMLEVVDMSHNSFTPKALPHLLPLLKRPSIRFVSVTYTELASKAGPEDFAKLMEGILKLIWIPYWKLDRNQQWAAQLGCLESAKLKEIARQHAEYYKQYPSSRTAPGDD